MTQKNFNLLKKPIRIFKITSYYVSSLQALEFITLKGAIYMLSKNEATVESNKFIGEWMDLKTAAAYLNVSYKTLRTFQTMGLEIVEIGRIRRVSKTALDDFMYKHSI